MPTLKRRHEAKEKRQGGNFRHIYQSYRWHKLSSDFIKRNPLCKTCLGIGIIEKSEVTDHVIPLVIWTGQMGKDPYDITNLQALSKVCHNRKTRNEQK